MTEEQIPENYEWFRSLNCEQYLHCPTCGWEYNHIVGCGLEYYPYVSETRKEQLATWVYR